MDNKLAQDLLDAFAKSTGFADGLSLDENGELTFVSDERFEFALALLDEVQNPVLMLSAHLGDIDEIMAPAANAIHVANRGAGSEMAPVASVQDDGKSAALALMLSLQDLSPADFEAAMDAFISTGLDLLDQFEGMRAFAVSGDDAEAEPAPDGTWVRV